MQIELATDVEEFVQEQVRSGQFDSPSAVLNVAIRMMRDRAQKRDAVRQAILEGRSVELARPQP